MSDHYLVYCLRKLNGARRKHHKVIKMRFVLTLYLRHESLTSLDVHCGLPPHDSSPLNPIGCQILYNRSAVVVTVHGSIGVFQKTKVLLNGTVPCAFGGIACAAPVVGLRVTQD